MERILRMWLRRLYRPLVLQAESADAEAAAASRRERRGHFSHPRRRSEGSHQANNGADDEHDHDVGIVEAARRGNEGGAKIARASAERESRPRFPHQGPEQPAHDKKAKHVANRGEDGTTAKDT